jgi:ribosomal protein S18 acetylase RimI-like enzyme
MIALQKMFHHQKQSYYIRVATPEDAEAIYAIKRDVFANTSLIYTIYQSPKSVYYLQELLSGKDIYSHHAFFVIISNQKLQGYYHAINNNKTWFLNYIAVAPVVQRVGLGKALLQHYHQIGQQHHCQYFALDALDANTRVLNWYYAHNYVLDSVSCNLLLDIGVCKKFNTPKLHWDTDDWKKAVAQEAKWGFSKLDCWHETGKITVGFITDRMCKLLNYEGCTHEIAINAICNQFWHQRRFLIITSLPDCLSSWSIVKSCKIAHLSRSV